MNQRLKEKIKESLTAVLPISAIVLLLSVTLTPMPLGMLMLFLSGAVLLILGMGLFSLGADMSMMPMGDGIGAELTKSKKLTLVIVVCFVMGVLITLAEPDLQVLAKQVPAIPDMVLLWTVGIGVGIFFVIAMLRTLFKVQLVHMLLLFYGLVFLCTALAPPDFIPVAFDSGGVTTGPITVPFIMALGVGMASVQSSKEAQENSFGFVALCSIGPILAVLLLGISYQPSGASYSGSVLPELKDTKEVAKQFLAGLPEYGEEVVTALVPIIVFFLIFQFISRRFQKSQLIRITVGICYTFLGLILFLTGVNIGFMPAGEFIGRQLASTEYRWILVPLGMLIGYFIVAAEPAVHVLNKQVEEVSGGAISQSAMQTSLSVGVACSVGLAILRILTGISIFWMLIPGYGIALGLAFVVPKMFTAIAFDSGGVASGPMTATFLLPFAMGACESVGGNILTDAFGIVAMVAMTPLITIQILGLTYQLKKSRVVEPPVQPILDTEDEIIDYAEVLNDETADH